MAGPDYLAQIDALLGRPGAPAGVAPMAPAPPLTFMQQAGAALGQPLVERGVIDNTPAAGGFSLTPPGAPPPPPVPGPAGPPMPPAPAAGPTPEPVAPRQHPFPLRMASPGGVANIPAHETEMRGPSLKKAQDDQNTAMGAAIDAVAERGQRTAAADYAVALERERQANIQADAQAYSVAERQMEMEQRQADFDMGVSALAKQAADPKNFYSEPNVGQKLAALISAGLAGFVAGKTGRPGNVGLDVINTWAAKEAKAQEMAWQLTRDTLQAKQTAFSMAMQKHNNIDAARAATRAALAEVGQAQLAKEAALWRGTEAQNQATLGGVELAKERTRQIASGVAFTPAQTVAQGPTYVDENGIRYSEAQARGVAQETRGQSFEREKQATGVAGQLMVEGAKQEAAQTKDQRAEMVQLPNGDVVRARDPAEAKDLSKLSAAVSQAQQLVNEAKQIRQGTSWRIPGSGDRARLEAIQSELTLSFKDRGGLGALSGPDMDLALAATGDVTAQRGTAEAKLDSFAKATNNALRARIKTLPDAPGTAKGEMPKSFTPHGKK